MILKHLKEKNQSHLLKWYDELNEKEKEALLSQINKIDWSLITEIDNDKEYSSQNLKPIIPLTINEINANYYEYKTIGIDAIKHSKIACVLLAGGMGTRLGFDHPKGMLNIGINKELYIFEMLVNNLLEKVKETKTWIHLFVMTNTETFDEIKHFFERNNWFNYNKEYIHFFSQDMAYCVNFDKKIMMSSKSSLVLSPNGNGGWYSSMISSGVIDIVRNNQIEYLNVFGVDNVLQNLSDPAFLGATIKGNYECSTKVVLKTSPEEKVGLLCLNNDKPSIIEYFEMDEETKNERDANGNLLYRNGIVLNYLFKVNVLDRIVEKKLPVHVVKKKINYMNKHGENIVPEEVNGYKFEIFIVDMLKYVNNILPFEVDRNKEFAPIKNAEGTDTIQTARALMKLNNIDF